MKISGKAIVNIIDEGLLIIERKAATVKDLKAVNCEYFLAMSAIKIKSNHYGSNVRYSLYILQKLESAPCRARSAFFKKVFDGLFFTE
jgi:hypothetical protein